MSLNNLASAVFIRYKQLGRMEDLEEAITYHREALTLRPLGHLDHSSSLNNLANVILTRYQELGRIEDLEEVIIYYREALTLRPPGSPNRSNSLNNLATAVLNRYRQTGRLEDLEEGITYYREALTLRPCGHPNRSGSINNLANAVLDRYEELGRTEDLEEGITYTRKALSLRPPGHPDRSSTFNSLGTAIHAHYEQSGRIEDLEEVIAYHREALALRPLGCPDRSSSLRNLADAIFTCYKQFGRMEDLEEAIIYYREALTLRPLGHSKRSMSLNHLASAVHARYQKSSMVQDLEETFMLCEQAVNDLAASSKDRLTAALHWARQARHHHHSSVIRAYSMSLHLLDRCLIFYPNVESQQKFLATIRIPRSLASNAASAAIDAQDLEAAVELLEQGRAILWSKMRGYRYSLDSLRQVHKQLADELEKISLELERLALSSEFESTLMDGQIPNLEVQMHRNRILTAEWEKIIEQIREIDGFRNFLRAVPFSTLRTAAAEGLVVLINVSNYRSDAIIIHIDNPPILVTLPNVRPKHLSNLAVQLSLALQPHTPKRSSLILPILRDLWNDILSPVCDRLTQLAVPRESRVWWCPTSKLCALPLHAAGLYEPHKNNFNLPDLYTSSYTPTLSALISARSSTAIGRSIVPKLLVIGQPGAALPNVQNEIHDIQQFGDFVDVILGEHANRDGVIRGLQQHSWAHFACHGHLGDNSQPFHASFQPHDQSHLTLLDLIQSRLPNAEFAFLASCHSAAGDPNTLDETIHLAAALQFCGFRSVVGTLWEMADKAGPIVSKEFYKYMFRHPGNKADIRDSAKGLSLAVRELRKQGAPLDCWIVLVHIGA
jgi:CHAT domain-containing protein